MSSFSRNILKYLDLWHLKPQRKPLILRGARQVGKSHAVRQFAAAHFKHLLEVNLELTPEISAIIQRNPPQHAIRLLEVQYGVPVIPGETLLFFDEVQAAPEVLARLRYFFEELPQLHVIAAGSLLDFALTDQNFSVPVGRVEYAYLGPATFSEFISALGEDALLQYLKEFNLPQINRDTSAQQISSAISEGIPQAIHQKALQLVRTFMLVGGMPEAVATYAATRSFSAVEEVKQALLMSIRDDFSKYSKRVEVSVLRRVFERLPKLAAQRIKYVEIDRELRSKKISDILELLCYARIITKVRHSASNGIPLGAEADDSIFKLIFLDVGLLSTACQITPRDLECADELNMINSGKLAEQFIGQHLLFRGAPYEEPSLFFWQREARNSSAEVDFVVSRNGAALPVEVKARKGSTLRSLHYFMAQKSVNTGVKFDSQPPSITIGSTTLADKKTVSYSIISLPHYLVDEMNRITPTQPN